MVDSPDDSEGSVPGTARWRGSLRAEPHRSAGLAAGLFLLPRRILITLVRAYRLLLSPSLGSSCRFFPTCSAYALEALERHGAMAGSGLTMWRIARCHPWCAGGHDPVPGRPPALFTGLLAARRSLLPSRKKSP